MPCLFRCDQNSTISRPPEYAEKQNKIGSKDISGEWKRSNFLVFPKGHLPHLSCKGIHMHPRPPLHKVINEKLTLNS